MSYSRLKSNKSTFQEVDNFENKLMRANQKLNELSSNNNKLREKINQLRKEKNSMEDIYSKLKHELESKKENVEKTIKFAGDAYYSRNKAEDDLRTLKEQS
jgi:chromosome segregation ATPase